jgi:hypothetical protein
MLVLAVLILIFPYVTYVIEGHIHVIFVNIRLQILSTSWTKFLFTLYKI